MCNQSRRTAPLLCGILIALVASLGIVQAAFAGTIAIEWDRSTDPTVIGYRVAVGTSPGVYTETFDVGTATSFVYEAADSRVYYLGVASYAAGPVVGEFSNPVSAIPSASGGVSPEARSFYEALWRNSVILSAAGRSASAGASRILRRSVTAAQSTPTAVCWAGISGCLSVRAVTRRSAELTSMAVSADDRLFFIEGGQRITVIASGVVYTTPVLVSASATVHFEQLHLDPAFAVTGLVYVGETETYATGDRDFRIVQYRVVQNRAEERTVVTTTRLPSTGRAAFAVSSSGHVYVSVPAGDSLGRTLGRVLRFSTDGTVPAEQGGSAVIAHGYATPTSAIFDEYAQRLWIAGTDDVGQPSVTTIGGPLAPTATPVTSLSIATADSGRTSLFAASATGALVTTLAQPDGTVTDSGELRIGTGLVRTVTATRSGELFVAVADESSNTGTSVSILRLNPLR